MSCDFHASGHSPRWVLETRSFLRSYGRLHTGRGVWVFQLSICGSSGVWETRPEWSVTTPCLTLDEAKAWVRRKSTGFIDRLVAGGIDVVAVKLSVRA